MENIQTVGQGIGAVLSVFCGCACSALPIIFIVYLGIYAFQNPDANAWYGIVDKENPALFKTHAEATTAGADEIVAIHSRM